jgi:ubiquitin-like 1-activating enzyme E1 B
LKRSREATLPANFEKDDEDSMMLVYCITTLRTYNFMNWHSPNNKHQFLSYYRCKDLIGKVMPAIASTNAIAAALEMR